MDNGLKHGLELIQVQRDLISEMLNSTSIIPKELKEALLRFVLAEQISLSNLSGEKKIFLQSCILSYNSLLAQMVSEGFPSPLRSGIGISIKNRVGEHRNLNPEFSKPDGCLNEISLARHFSALKDLYESNKTAYDMFLKTINLERKGFTFLDSKTIELEDFSFFNLHSYGKKIKYHKFLRARLELVKIENIKTAFEHGFPAFNAHIKVKIYNAKNNVTEQENTFKITFGTSDETAKLVIEKDVIPDMREAFHIYNDFHHDLLLFFSVAKTKTL